MAKVFLKKVCDTDKFSESGLSEQGEKMDFFKGEGNTLYLPRCHGYRAVHCSVILFPLCLFYSYNLNVVNT